MNIQNYMQTLGQQAKAAARILSHTDTNLKNRALIAIANALQESKADLMTENQKDLVAGKENGFDDASLDRLTL